MEGVENGVESVDPLRVGELVREGVVEVGLLVVGLIAPDLGKVRCETPWLVATRRMADLAEAEVSGRSAFMSYKAPRFPLAKVEKLSLVKLDSMCADTRAVTMLSSLACETFSSSQ